MEEFNNVELKDEELDQVAGGVRTVTYERQEDGRVKVTRYLDEREIAADGTVIRVDHSESEKVFPRKYSSRESLQKSIDIWKKQGYEIIFKGFEGI